MKKLLRFWLPVILWMIVIFAFSSRQKVAVTDSYVMSFMFFKTLHLIEYVSLYIFTFRALKNTVNKKQKYWYYGVAFCIVCIYAASDELHQRYVPTREGRPRDVIIDALGGGLGWISIQYILPILPKKLKSLASEWQLK